MIIDTEAKQSFASLAITQKEHCKLADRKRKKIPKKLEHFSKKPQLKKTYLPKTRPETHLPAFKKSSETFLSKNKLMTSMNKKQTLNYKI